MIVRYTRWVEEGPGDTRLDEAVEFTQHQTWVVRPPSLSSPLHVEHCSALVQCRVETRKTTCTSPRPRQVELNISLLSTR